MDFEPTERQKHWRDRVRHFIDTHVRPRNDEYKAAHAKDRWGVNPVIEDADITELAPHTVDV